MNVDAAKERMSNIEESSKLFSNSLEKRNSELLNTVRSINVKLFGAGKEDRTMPGKFFQFIKEMDEADWEEYRLIRLGREVARMCYDLNKAFIGIIANYNKTMFVSQKVENDFSSLVSDTIFNKSIQLSRDLLDEIENMQEELKEKEELVEKAKLWDEHLKEEEKKKQEEEKRINEEEERKRIEKTKEELKESGNTDERYVKLKTELDKISNEMLDIERLNENNIHAYIGNAIRKAKKKKIDMKDYEQKRYTEDRKNELLEIVRTRTNQRENTHKSTPLHT